MNNLEGVRSGEREDATLVFALRAGERWAPKAILDRYSDRVSRFFARSTGRRLHDLEDLTQDVFLRVFACRAIQKPGSLRHFIMSVAARVLSRQIRYQQIRRSVCLSATGDVPEIRSRERAAFVLRYLEGMSLEEVAGQLNVSISTAKRLIRRAANKISTRVARTPTAEIAHTD
jgi:DNA-directed RNA polymerase specialized sigma24 family protein